MKKIVVDCETNEIKEIELTEKEIKQREKDQIEMVKLREEQKQREIARQKILDRLGLTQEEVQLLLG